MEDTPKDAAGVIGPISDLAKGEGRLTIGDSVDESRSPSTDDDRTRNNVVRHEYRTLTPIEKAQMARIKDLGAEFIGVCQSVGQSRELSLAVTNAEQAVMWAVKHITR